MILCIGEILLDVTSNQKDYVLLSESHPGGAPFNVAANIAIEGGNASFFGKVGADSYGSFLKQCAERLPLKECNILVDPFRPTSVALVSLIEGERHFKFLRHDSADYLREEDFPDQSFIDPYNIVHLGGLCIDDPSSHMFLLELMRRIRLMGKLVSFDVNYREDVSGDYIRSRALYEPLLKEVDILKISLDELPMLRCEDEEDFIKRYCKGKAIVFLTKGKDGSDAIYNGRRFHADSENISPVDTTGAGDAFLAKALSLLDFEDDIYSLSDEKIMSILESANNAGREAILHRGAIDFSSVMK